jgi:hypothetical protein
MIISPHPQHAAQQARDIRRLMNEQSNSKDLTKTDQHVLSARLAAAVFPGFIVAVSAELKDANPVVLATAVADLAANMIASIAQTLVEADAEGSQTDFAHSIVRKTAEITVEHMNAAYNEGEKNNGEAEAGHG